MACHESAAGPSVRSEKCTTDRHDRRWNAESRHDLGIVDRLRKATKLKLFIKGIDTREDAQLAVEHGFDGFWFRIMAADPRKQDDRPSRLFPKWSTVTAGFRCLWMEESGAEGTCSSACAGAKAVGIGRHSVGWERSDGGRRPGPRNLQAELKLVMGNCGTGQSPTLTAPTCNAGLAWLSNYSAEGDVHEAHRDRFVSAGILLLWVTSRFSHLSPARRFV